MAAESGREAPATRAGKMTARNGMDGKVAEAPTYFFLANRRTKTPLKSPAGTWAAPQVTTHELPAQATLPPQGSSNQPLALLLPLTGGPRGATATLERHGGGLTSPSQ